MTGVVPAVQPGHLNDGEYLVVTSLDPTGKGRARWSNRTKAALNAFDITFDGRTTAARR